MSNKALSVGWSWRAAAMSLALLVACGGEKPAENPQAPAAPTEGAAEPKGAAPVAPQVSAETIVEILEFSDFQCPFCSKVGPTLKELKATYGDKVRVEFLHQPLTFHKQARPAAIAAEAARKQGKFWEMHDELFANQQNLREADFEKYALKVGLDMDQFKKDVADPAISATVDRHQAIATAVGATGTPAFFINGKALRGAVPPEAFKKIIDEELAESAKENNAKGPEWVKARTQKNNELLFGFIYGGKTPPPVAPPRPPVDKTVYKVAVDPAMDAIKGEPNALVTLVVFSEFQCPFCKKMEPILAQLMTDFPGKLRIVFKHNPLPFHKDALPASMAALCAKDQGKFWEMHDLLWDNQQSLDAESLDKYAAQLTLDLEAFKGCMTTGKHRAQIKSDEELALKVSARGTPNTFVNGRKLVGARPIEEFKELVEEELKKAEAVLARLGSPEKVYEEIIKDGKVFEPLEERENTFRLEGSPLLGKPDAKIQIVEYSDFQCPFCARVTQTLKDLKAKYGDELVVAFKHFPLAFHREAMPAALASMCAHEQGKFWEYHDQLFSNMKHLLPENLKGYAQAVGLDAAKFEECVASNRHQAKIDADMTEARAAGVRGTPSIYINGRKFTPPDGFTVNSFSNVIDKYILGK